MGAGSLDLAEWTLASRRCIWAVSERTCDSELEAGILCLAKLELFVDRGTGVRRAAPPPDKRLFWRVVDDLTRGFGVTLLSRDGRRVLRLDAPTALAVATGLARGAGSEASDMGGEGGSCTSDIVSSADNSFVSGGVVISGELAVE